ncbi:hypothetical protein J1N35_029042 [Gossypium stocksii]|uniref:Uncharacterized protein n=1 Tax=Gossypium stocksii TaxID=47602 RepID=A0A9D3UXE2_9ROSI|nr:hypothetical protein J1N35_029042 [Gossypium stocksii]
MSDENAPFAHRGSPWAESTVARMTHLSRTMMLGVFATLSAGHYMVLHSPPVNRREELKVILVASILLARLAYNMA